MYESKTPIREIIAAILLIIFVFFILPWLLSLGDNDSKNIPDIDSSYQYDGHL